MPIEHIRREREATWSVLRGIQVRLRELAFMESALQERLREVLSDVARQRSFRAWLELCKQDATNVQPISPELASLLAFRQPRATPSRLALIDACLDALDAFSASGRWSREDPAADPPLLDYELRLLLAAGLNISFIKHNPGREESNYYWLLADLLPPDRVADILQGFTISDEQGTNGWVVGLAYRSARRSQSFFQWTPPTALFSLLADPCGHGAIEDLFTGKHSAFMVPIFGEERQSPVGTIYVGFPAPGLFYDEAMDRALPFVYQLWSRVIRENRGQLTSAVRVEWERRVNDLWVHRIRRQKSDAGLGSLDLLDKVLPRRTQESDAPGFLVGGHAWVRPDGAVRFSIGIRENTFINRLFHSLTLASYFPDDDAPGYVRWMDEWAKGGRAPRELASQEIEAHHASTFVELSEGLEKYAPSAGVYDMVLPVVSGSGSSRRSMGFLRVNCHRFAAFSPEVWEHAHAAFREPSARLGEVLESFEEVLSDPTLDLDAIRLVAELRTALCRMAACVLVEGLNHVQGEAYDRLELGLRTLPLVRLGDDDSHRSWADRLPVAISQARELLMAVCEELAGLDLGQVTLVSFWASWPRFVVSKVDAEQEELGKRKAELRTELNLLKFVASILELLDSAQLDRVGFRTHREGHARIRGHLIVVPALALWTRLLIERAEADSWKVTVRRPVEGEVGPLRSLTMRWERRHTLFPEAYVVGEEALRRVMVPELGAAVVRPTHHAAWEGALEEATRVSLDDLFEQPEEGGSSPADWCRQVVSFVERRTLSTSDRVWRAISAGELPSDGLVFAYGREDSPEVEARPADGEWRESTALREVRDHALERIRQAHVERIEGWKEAHQRARRKVVHSFTGKLIGVTDLFEQTLPRLLELPGLQDLDRGVLDSVGYQLARLSQRCKLQSFLLEKESHLRLVHREVDVQELAEDFLRLMEGRNLKIRRAYGPPGRVEAPEEVVEVVVEELIFNAIQHVTAYVSGERWLEVSTRAVAGGLEFAVTNPVTPGAERHALLVYERARQGESTDPHHIKGFGTGLVVLDKLARASSRRSEFSFEIRDGVCQAAFSFPLSEGEDLR